ncbi:MAG: EF-hand domain-containing protein [Planctomycetota bacterium]|nr:EF-hand domain-containing protein [Planctomycetota bacterium]
MKRSAIAICGLCCLLICGSTVFGSPGAKSQGGKGSSGTQRPGQNFQGQGGAGSGFGQMDRKRAEMFKRAMKQRFDVNGNGVLEPNERTAKQAAMQNAGMGGMQGGNTGVTGGGLPNGAANGTKGASGKSKRGPNEKILKEFDKNNDGKLDASEKAAIQAARKNRTSKKN